MVRIKFDGSGNYLGSLTSVCSEYTQEIAFITGSSLDSAPYTYYHCPNNPKGYKYLKEYPNAGMPGDINIYRYPGVTSLRYNTTVNTERYNETQLKEIFNNPASHVEELRNMEGLVFYWNPKKIQHDNGKAGTYTAYTHTGILGPYDPVNKEFTIYHSTRSTDTNGKILQDGRGTTTISLLSLLDYANEGSIILSEYTYGDGGN